MNTPRFSRSLFARPTLTGSLFLVLASVASGASSVGCNGILDIKEAHLDPNWDSTGGTSSGGTSGSGGTYYTGGEPGVGGGIIPDGCAPLAREEIYEDALRGCILRASCDPWGGYTISSCLTYARQARTVPEACTFAATDCATIDSCIGRGYVDQTLCDGVTSSWTCTGDTAYNCSSTAYQFDCAAVGSTCVPFLEGATTTGMPPCKVDDVACSEPAGEFHCSDNTLYECIDGVRYGWDCGTRTSTCVEADYGDAYCRESQTTCDTPGESTCDGSTLSSCADDGMLIMSDCAIGNLTCLVEDYCVAPGCTTTDVDNCTEGCIGTALSLCVGGARVEVDCTEYGYASCSTFDSDGLTHAYCYGEGPIGGTGGSGTGGAGGIDTCVYANDGYCDEPSLCAPGTDTTDCYLTGN